MPSPTRPAEAARVGDGKPLAFDQAAVLDSLMLLIRLGERRRARLAAQASDLTGGAIAPAGEQTTQQEGKSHQ